MSERRYVFLDPDGSLSETWLYVVVHAATGVIYQQQYGGTACRQGEVEGYLVPVSAPDALAALRDLFERTLQGAGTWNYSWPDEQVSRLRQEVGRIPFWASHRSTDERHLLSFDDSRLTEADEAWLPVITPDGPGVMVWCNSD